MSLVTYYLPWHDPDDPASGIQIPELSEDNYTEWSLHVQRLLQLDPDKLWNVVGADDEPTEANLVHRQRAEDVIMQAIGQKSYRYEGSPEYKDNPKKLWDTVKKDALKMHSPISLRLRLSTTYLGKFPSVTEYTRKIDTLVKLLELIKSRDSEWRMDSDEHAFWYLHGLPESWNEYVQELRVKNAVLDQSDESNSMSNHKQLKEELRAYEGRLREREERDRHKTC